MQINTINTSSHHNSTGASCPSSSPTASLKNQEQMGQMIGTHLIWPFRERYTFSKMGVAETLDKEDEEGTTCDCGRYRKVVGQLDINTGKLRNAVKFLKNVILGLRETEERYYLLVKEPKRFREASMNCKLRGGNLAMPKTTNTNRLMADYVSQTGLTKIYIGVHAQSIDRVSGPQKTPTTNSSCVELLSTGAWSHVECEATMFFMCEFTKSRRRGGERRIPS
uniref:Collectin subfamily member 10 n=1 Tax=Echeneis naucrates TaxID=173247 RepID=A0A665T3X1_ECHNA